MQKLSKLASGQDSVQTPMVELTTLPTLRPLSKAMGEASAPQTPSESSSQNEKAAGFSRDKFFFIDL